jgi:hypothetical protein
MATELFTLEHAEELIAELRGQVDRLSEVLGTSTGSPIQVTDPLVATDPVNGGPETWHTLGTLSHYTVTRGRFRLTPAGETELDIDVAGDASNVVTTTFSVTVPAAYRPAVTRRATTSQSGRNITAGDQWPTVVLNTSGTVDILCPAAGATTAMHWNGSFPLD